MVFFNGNIFNGFGFVPGGFEVVDGRFRSVLEVDDSAGGVDLKGAFVIPGLIDLHNHGNSGADFSDGDLEGLKAMGRFLLKNGITGFAPASMTLPYPVLEKAFSTAKDYSDNRPAGGARLLGIQMEGPYFSEKKKGAQNADYLKLPDFEGFKALYEGCGGLVKIVDLAAELPGAVEFTQKARELCRVSIAHTDASYEQASRVFAAGASHVTHLFNAMPPIHHRKPGVIGAAAERECVVGELICDGLHVHESVVRMAFKLFPGRICLVSDALRCCGMPDGEYELGGQQVFLKDSIARLEDGTIAGSATDLYRCMLNAIDFGIPAAEAILAATLTPAIQLGWGDELGSIEEGKLADFLLCDEDLALKQVFIGGKALS